MTMPSTAEHRRLGECHDRAVEAVGGPYLSERAWGTVRDNYAQLKQKPREMLKGRTTRRRG